MDSQSSINTPADTPQPLEASSNDSEPESPSSLTTLLHSKKRPRKRADIIWTYARPPILGVEPVRTATNRRIWYCLQPQCATYSVSSTSGARHHMVNKHGTILPSEEPSKVRKSINGDIKGFFSKQQLNKHEQESAIVRRGLQTAVDIPTVRQALLRLIVNHDLPVSTVEWPELHTFVRAINPEATNCLWTSHQSVSNHIGLTFDLQREQLKESLQQSLSLIHLTTDTWHSPNHTELQAITAHWIDSSKVKRKALLDLPELPNGHAGVEVAPFILETLRSFNIEHKLGYITADNHGANDKMCEFIATELSEFNPLERRLRCMGHMINIAIQAFLFAANKEAVEVALKAAESQAHGALEDELYKASQKDGETGWLKVAPLQKILSFVTTLRRSDTLYKAFKTATGKQIRTPNDTRWNSYLFTFEDALELRAAYSAFIVDNPPLSEYELTVSEWLLVEETVKFLRPFKEATKRTEGDHVTLDKVQIELDSLREHFTEQAALQKGNTSFSESIITSWYAFDKYYDLVDRSAAYIAAVLLHPNLRYSYIHSSWKTAWIKPGVEGARAIWNQYKKDEPMDESGPSEELSLHERRMARIQANQRRGKGAKDEFERFIYSPADNIDISALDWWLEPSQERTYPQLSQMAINILSAPAMSAESERVFSGARRTVSWTRASLETLLIKQLECLKHWHKSGLINHHFEVERDTTTTIQDPYSLLEGSSTWSDTILTSQA
jgi:hypothetical protein